MVAIAINVVTTEEDAGFVTIGNLGKPANWLASWCLAEIFGVDLGGVAIAKDVVARVADDGQGLFEALLDHATLSGIARSVNRELANGTGVPCGGCRSSLHGVSDSDGGLARSEGSGHDSGSSKEHKSRGTSSHFDIDLKDCEEVLRFEVRTGVQ